MKIIRNNISVLFVQVSLIMILCCSVISQAQTTDVNSQVLILNFHTSNLEQLTRILTNQNPMYGEQLIFGQYRRQQVEALIASSEKLIEVHNSLVDEFKATELNHEARQNLHKAREAILGVYKKTGLTVVKDYNKQSMRLEGYTKTDLEFKNELTERMQEVVSEKKINKIRKKLGAMANEWKTAFPAFTVAEGVVSALQSSSNPVAVEQFVQRQVDDPILNTSSFAIFIAGSHLFQDTIGRRLSPGVKMQLGMASGMFFSTVYTELYNDVFKDGGLIKECHKRIELPSYPEQVSWLLHPIPIGVDERLKVELRKKNEADIKEIKEQELEKLKQNRDQACLQAGERWLTRDKYAGYTPDVTSLVAAGMLNHATMGLIAPAVKIVDKATFKTIISPAGKLIKGSSALNPIGVFSLTVGNFVIFMEWHHIIMPMFTVPWNHYNFHKLGWSQSEELKKNKPEHTEHIRKYKHNLEKMDWLTKNLDIFNESHGGDLYDQCIEGILKNKKIENGLTLMNMSDDFYLKGHKKQVDACMMENDPAKILELDHAFQKEKNKIAFMDFELKQESWLQLVGNYTALHESARKFYNLIAAIRENRPLPDGYWYPEEVLRKEFLYQYIEDKKELYPAGKNGIEFNHLVDYLIYQMACGPSFSSSKGTGRQASINFNNKANMDVVKTAFGSSLEFVPPKMVTSKKNFCFSGMNADIYKYKMNEKGDDAHSIFNGAWYEGLHDYSPEVSGLDKPHYSNLLEFVYDHFDTKFVSPEGYNLKQDQINLYSWDTHILPVVEEVWDQYEVHYLEMMKTELMPFMYYTREFPKKAKIYDIPTHYNKFIKFISKKSQGEPLVPAFQKRVSEKLTLIQQMAETFDASNDELLDIIAQLDQQVTEELDEHIQWLVLWKNEGSLPVDDAFGENDSFSRRIEYLLSTLQAAIDYEETPVENSYSLQAIEMVLKPACDENELTFLQEQELITKPELQLLNCGSSDMAEKLHNNYLKTKNKNKLMAKQVELLEKEINDYYAKIRYITIAIGVFK